MTRGLLHLVKAKRRILVKRQMLFCRHLVIMERQIRKAEAKEPLGPGTLHNKMPATRANMESEEETLNNNMAALVTAVPFLCQVRKVTERVTITNSPPVNPRVTLRQPKGDTVLIMVAAKYRLKERTIQRERPTLTAGLALRRVALQRLAVCLRRDPVSRQLSLGHQWTRRRRLRMRHRVRQRKKRRMAQQKINPKLHILE